MTVGLVIVTFQSSPFIARCLEAVARQTRRPDRAILIDNASTDATPDVARATAARLGLPLEIVELDRNEGFARANNLAVGRLRGCEAVALLNPDAFPEPGWLAALIAAAEAHPEAASVASCLLADDVDDVLDGAGDIYHVSGLAWRCGHKRPVAEVPEARVARPVFAACAAAALYRRHDWAQAGGFDERFFCYMEDVDLGFRLQLMGRGCWYEPAAIARHIGSAASGVGSAFAVYHGHRNLEWAWVKNMPALLLWRHLPAHLTVWVFSLVYFSLRGRGASIWKAKAAALLGMGQVLAARRQVQHRRDVSAQAVAALLDRSSLVSRFLARSRPQEP